LDDETCFGGINAKVEPGPMTYLRLSTDDPFTMLGSIAVCETPNLPKLLEMICRQGFEHHSAMVRTHCASVVVEAATVYLGWNVTTHGG
jgi:L-fucose isomerase-like protein